VNLFLASSSPSPPLPPPLPSPPLPPLPSPPLPSPPPSPPPLPFPPQVRATDSVHVVSLSHRLGGTSNAPTERGKAFLGMRMVAYLQPSAVVSAARAARGDHVSTRYGRGLVRRVRVGATVSTAVAATSAGASAAREECGDGKGIIYEVALLDWQLHGKVTMAYLQPCDVRLTKRQGAMGAYVLPPGPDGGDDSRCAVM
jgi:hypothetical protein